MAITAVAVVVGVALRFWPRSGMWLDEALTATAGFDWSGYGPPLAALTEVLAAMEAPEGMRVTAAEPPPAAP